MFSDVTVLFILNMIFVDFQGVEVALSTDVLQDISATKPTKQKKENPQTVSGL